MGVKHLSIDIETRSSVDIAKAGAYKYAQSPDFQILLFAYQFGEDPVEIIDFTDGETLPKELVPALKNPKVIKHAYNAAFEWYCLTAPALRPRSISGDARWHTDSTAVIPQDWMQPARRSASPG